QKLYELARRGVEIERQPVPVHIHEFEAQTPNGTLLQTNEDGTIDLNARVRCSAGTYIRVLAEMIGERLGAGAHLARLRRTRAGAFRIEDAVTLDELQRIIEAGETERIVISPDAALSHMPFVHLTAGQTRQARNGVAARIEASQQFDVQDGAHVRMRDEHGNLIAIGIYSAADARVQPRISLASLSEDNL
ncbi:MAG: hypothetical protein H0V88_02585, partial [Pyrinomonadaceae bacterium]|nr:hypothetical protein [Pyrinomonadaceae bacterium]